MIWMNANKFNAHGGRSISKDATVQFGHIMLMKRSKMSYTKDEILHAMSLRKEWNAARLEHTDLSREQAEAKGSRKAGLTRRLKKVHTRILELNVLLLDLAPPPLEPDEAIAAVEDIFLAILATADSAKAHFLEHCQNNPDYAVKYHLADMLLAKAKVDLFRHISKVLQSDSTLDMLKKIVGDTRDRIMNEHVLSTVSLSTSRESNLLDDYKHEAAVQLLQKRMASTNVFEQMDSIFSGVEVWQILNELDVDEK